MHQDDITILNVNEPNNNMRETKTAERDFEKIHYYC